VSFARAADGTRLHYEVIGPAAAPPLLLIQGLGADARGWVLQRRALARQYRCILFDNRGVGRSEVPSGPYELEVMAADAAAVLQAAGYPSAHVLGASMGGVIAQILAVRHPHQVRSLMLACTACRHEPWRRELLEDWACTAEEGGMRALAVRVLRWVVGPRSHQRLYLPAQLFRTLLLGLSVEGFVNQARAILSMHDDVRAELAGIQVPTLVIVGSQDILTPVGDSEELAERIPDAELVVLGGAGHAVMAERVGVFNRTVLGFLDRVAGPSIELPAVDGLAGG
jgi:3-oxoadipate enol-lactonase